MSHEPPEQATDFDGVVLDIGGTRGALVLYTDPDRAGTEVEISRVGDDASRTHTGVHGRQMGQETVFAGVFPQLEAGEYQLWSGDPGAQERVTIVGGEVAIVDWRTTSE